MNLNRIAQVMILTAAGALLAAASPVDSWTKMDTKALAERAKSAKSAEEHRAVARQYEERALTFDAKAAQHEQEADKMTKRQREQYNPLSSKWPAMVQGPVDRERGKALQAKRAARESREVMAYHLEQAAKLTTAE